MEITRLTKLVGADAREVERLIVEIEQRPADRDRLMHELARALHFGPPDVAVTAGATAPARTDIADAAALDLGFD